MRVEREITLPADLEQVWAAVADGSRLAEWLGGGSTPAEVDLDVTAGASGRLREAGEPARQVQVEVVEPRRRVRFQWWPEDGSGPLSEVDITLAEVDGRTRLRVVETFVAPPLPPDAGRRLGFQLRARALVGA